MPLLRIMVLRTRKTGSASLSCRNRRKHNPATAKMPEKRKVTEYFVGRQPIFAADGRLTAYELLFRAAADD